MIPWRVKNFVSEHFPLGYHLLSNLRLSRSSEQFWDYAFDVSWEAGSRDWPNKNRLVQMLTSPEARILDLGCGTRSTLRFLRDQGYQNLEGLEISSRAVEVLGAHGITMHKAILPDVPTSDSHYDVVIASQVLEHMIFRRKFLRQVKQTLKPDGAFLVFVPDNCLGPIDEPGHVLKFTKERLTKELSEFFPNIHVDSIRDENFEIPVLFAYAQGEEGSMTLSDVKLAVETTFRG